MNLRHAAALALVGSYLLTPPFNKVTGVMATNAPFSIWGRTAYDTAAACEAAHQKAIKSDDERRAEVMAMSTEDQRKFYEFTDGRSGFPISASPSVQQEFWFNAACKEVCIASDDPELAR